MSQDNNNNWFLNVKIEDYYEGNKNKDIFVIKLKGKRRDLKI